MPELRLLSSHDEIGNIRTFVFETGGMAWKPGQYQEYVLPQAGESKDDSRRFFTIASAPSEGEIHISTRISGSAFKQALNALKPGETIQADGLDGDFTWDDDTVPVLVAGGIGVTPYRSMLLERRALGRSLHAILLYFNRDEAVAFRAEFDAIVAEFPELQIRYVTDKPITAAAILEETPEATDHVTYVSGPEAMVDSIGEALKQQGVVLKQDWFPGYDEQTY